MIRDDKELQTALASLKNGTTLTIASGDYRGGYSIRGVDQLTVEALDPQHPPHFKGGLCAAAFVGVDGAEFNDNTIAFPRKWIFRILQEMTLDGFVPCRNVVVKDNRIVFRRSEV